MCRYRPDSIPVETRLLSSSSRFTTVFDSLPGKHFKTTRDMCRFNTVHPGSPRLSTHCPSSLSSNQLGRVITSKRMAVLELIVTDCTYSKVVHVPPLQNYMCRFNTVHPGSPRLSTHCPSSLSSNQLGRVITSKRMAVLELIVTDCTYSKVVHVPPLQNYMCRFNTVHPGSPRLSTHCPSSVSSNQLGRVITSKRMAVLELIVTDCTYSKVVHVPPLQNYAYRTNFNCICNNCNPGCSFILLQSGTYTTPSELSLAKLLITN